MVTVAISPSERSDIKYTLMPSPINQNVINLVMHLSIRIGPVAFVSDAMGQHGAFDN
jgi:hypothetical protein